MPPPLQHQLLPMKMGAAVRRLSPAFLEKQSRRLLSGQNADGGWAGRGGGSDLYYTSFAIRTAELLGVKDEGVWRGALGYLADVAPAPADIVECCAFAEAWRLAKGRADAAHVPEGKRPEDLAAVVGRFRQGDSYCREPGAPGSVYLAYLAWRAFAALGMEMPGQAQTAAWVAARRNADGGFAESEGAASSGANPTAAGYCFLAANGPLCVCVGEGAAFFLASMQRPGGGFAAHALAPEADLLSTFTALYALAAADSAASADLPAAARFVKALACPEGGFRGSPSDPEGDAEYHFYGLGSLGVLAAVAGTRGS